MTSYKLLHAPTVVGYWRIGDSFLLSVTKRPNELHRWFTAAFLGWQWVDAA
ncbi:hypothetical protein ACUDTL_16780 [Stenotrophomonas pavanii]|uniref:hypothetical protein n=1 Tax=Stenotrophomonas pavanii TaxID=487698 RepID=UPI0040423B6A